MQEFDLKARDWDKDPTKIERAQAVAEAIRQRVTLAGHICALEYGCGTGLLSFALQPYLSRITLADNSDGMLAVVREKIAAADVQNMIPLKLDLAVDPLPPERFHLVYTLMTLHHIPDTERIMGAFHDLLEPSGTLCVVDLDSEDGSFHRDGFVGHQGLDRADLARQAERAGFRNVTFSTVYELSKETALGRKTFPLFLMIAERG